MKAKKVFYVSAFLIVVVVVVLWSMGLFGLWTNGMSYIANNTKDYTYNSGHLVEGSYSLEIGLSDLESNIGREIYSDDDHHINLAWLQRTQDDGYDVGFRASGPYSLTRATLVSGIKHETNSNHSFSILPSAKLIVEYEGKTNEAQLTGKCGINYKDGDCFSFTFFLKDHSNGEAVGNPGSVKLTITDLFKNIWSKK